MSRAAGGSGVASSRTRPPFPRPSYDLAGPRFNGPRILRKEEVRLRGGSPLKRPSPLGADVDADDLIGGPLGGAAVHSRHQRPGHGLTEEGRTPW